MRSSCYLPALSLGLCGLLLGAEPSDDAVSPPAPWGPVPSTAQLGWHAMELYGLVHFGICTFADREWGYGSEPPSAFNPTAFDADQIVGVARDARLKGLILVCKHHDGFCLWPSQFTEHSVKNSPWKEGKGDMVKEFADSCKRHGLQFGVYLSAWDRNRADYGSPEYLAYYRSQLKELLTNYGEVFMAWFDGANGGEGYYGGVNGMRHVDIRTYYEWPTTWSLVRKLQPSAMIFSDAGPDVRWVGNESGLAGSPCWMTITSSNSYPGAPNWNKLAQGDRMGKDWVPPECDVSIRPGWFYHRLHEGRSKSPTQLLDMYYTSVGRGASLDIGLAPDLRGLLPEEDALSLREMGRILNATFATNLITGARVVPSAVRGNQKAFRAEHLLDGDLETYWTTEDKDLTPEVVVELPHATTFDVVRVREHIALGQRIEAFALDQWEEGAWKEFYRGTTVGFQALARTKPIQTTKVRLRVVKSAACPAISEIGLYLQPPMAIQPKSTGKARR